MDREAEFRRLYEAHRVAVHAYFAGRTGDRQSAADLMQEVFLRAWQHLDKLSSLPEDGQRGWLFTVARNLSVDAARHQRTTDGTRLHRRVRHPDGRQHRPGPAGRVSFLLTARASG
jgi:RNA polymerase sigma-70 factor (ECF subfamily)